MAVIFELDSERGLDDQNIIAVFAMQVKLAQNRFNKIPGTEISYLELIFSACAQIVHAYPHPFP